MEVRGSVTDRPWGVTLGAIAMRRHTGQLTLDSDGKRFCIVFEDGAIVGASSPLAADATARVALTNHFITSSQVPDIARRLAQAGDRDEADVLAEVARFTPEQVARLRHRLVAQRAARTFSLERGDFVLDGRVTVPVAPGVAVDHRHVIYLGVRTNLAEQRLIDDLRQLGAYFVLKPEAVDELARFGFEASAQPVLDALKLGTSLPELEASHRDLDPRSAQAIIYALVSCATCVVPPRSPAPPPGVPRTVSREPAVARRPTAQREPLAARTATRPREPATRAEAPVAGTGTQPPFAAGTATFSNPVAPGATAAPFVAPNATRPRVGEPTESPFAPRTQTGSATGYSSTAFPDTGTNTPAATRPRAVTDPGAATTPPAPSRTATAPAASPTISPTTPRTATAPAASPTISPTAPRTATPPAAARTGTGPSAPRTVSAQPPPAAADPPRPAMARTATSEADIVRSFMDHRTPTGFPEQRTPGFGDQRTPADQRTPTDPTLARTPTGNPVPGAPATGRVSTDNAAAAEAAFKRGELAMKRDQPGEAVLEYKAACDLNPQDVDYAGMLAWAKFCAAGDKPAIGADTRKALERAVFKSNKPERARFYLGRVERMLGRDKEALRHFQEVIDLKPNHADAASEIRAIEARLQAAAKGPGLFGRKR